MRRVTLLTFILTAIAGVQTLADEPEKPKWQFSAELLRPFWEGDTVEGESVLFIRETETGDARASVLFPIQEIRIIAVTAWLSHEHKLARLFLGLACAYTRVLCDTKQQKAPPATLPEQNEKFVALGEAELVPYYLSSLRTLAPTHHRDQDEEAEN